MQLALRRIILFTRRMAPMTAFYRDVLGLVLFTDEPKWKDFDAHGARLALHLGTPAVGRRSSASSRQTSPRCAPSSSHAGRPMQKIITGAGVMLCDGTDPDGNVFQLSNRA